MSAEPFGKLLALAGWGAAPFGTAPLDPEETPGEIEADAPEPLESTQTEDIHHPLPAAMLEAPRWLVWRSIPNPDPTKKPRKVPFYCDGTPRQGTLDTEQDLGRLTDYATARTALAAGAYAGLGFALGPDGDGNHWQGIDLDGTDERPNLAALAESLPGYVERSPSGKGFHAIGLGRDFATLGSNASGIEAYSHGRYFTVTGTDGRGDLEDIADFVTGTLAPMHLPARPKPEPSERPRVDSHDAVVRDLRSALASLRADDRDLWVRMGLSLKTLGEAGRGLWLEWGQSSEKYDAADAARVWESLRPESTDYRAVFAEAQRSGWVNPSKREAKDERTERPHDTPPREPRPNSKPIDTGSVTVTNASAIKVEPISWAWPGWLARGKLHIIAGAPGTGKTTVGMALAATVTLGGRWPDGTKADQGHVMIWSGEDDPKDTLVPRLIAAGADLSRVHIVTGYTDSEGSRSFDPSRDAVALADHIADMNPPPSLLIVDPIVSAVAGDSHKNAEVRRALQPLVDLALVRRCAVLGVSHFSKGSAGQDPVNRVTGSLAFGALARVVLATAKLPDEEGGGRILARAKSNIGPDSGGFAYELDVCEAGQGIETTRVLWGEVLEGSARDLLGAAETQSDPDERSALEDAKEFLRSLLAKGPVPSKQLMRDAHEAGHAERTLKRAKKVLGVEATKSGMKAPWMWSLPAKGAKDAEECHQTRTGNHGPLRESWPPSGDDEEVF